MNGGHANHFGLKEYGRPDLSLRFLEPSGRRSVDSLVSG